MIPKTFEEVIAKCHNIKWLNSNEVQCDCDLLGHKTPAKHATVTNYGEYAVYKCFNNESHNSKAFAQLHGWDSLKFPANNNGQKAQFEPRREIEAIYDYKKDGQLIFQVVRTNPKGFYQRRPDGKGDFIDNLKGIEPFLYHHDEVVKAVASGDTVYVPEGEKDADTLWNYGLIATTNPMGAGKEKWHDSYTETLKGAKSMVILKDSDKVGEDFALYKASVLYGKVQSLKVPDLPSANEKLKDITDWIEAGHHADELAAIVAHTPEWTPDWQIQKHLIWLNTVKPVAIDWLWFPYIALRKLTIVSGDPGDGKSTLLAAIAAGVSKGANIGLVKLPTGKTLIMSAEDGIADTIVPRLLKMGADMTQIVVPDELLTLDDAGMELLKRFIEIAKPTMVVIDPLQAYLDREMNTNQSNQVRYVMSRLAKIAESYGSALVVIRHLTKGSNQKAIYRGAGSIDFTGSARSELITGLNEETGERALIHSKCNLAPKGESIGYKLIDGGLEWTGKSEMTYRDVSSENGSAIDDAKAWLEQILLSGDKESDFIFTEGKKLYNLSPATLKRAKKVLGITSYCKPELGKKGAGQWYWNIPGVEKNN